MLMEHSAICNLVEYAVEALDTAVCVATSHSRCTDIVKEYRFS